MRNVRRVLRLISILIVGLLLHYVLPQQDVARITSTEVIRTDFSRFNRLFYAQADAGAVEQTTRDLRLINTERVQTYLFGLIRTGRETMVYRNEDTGWIWPPYFKFDSSDLQAEAAADISTTEPYDWVVITHYGWRIRFASIYPNAVSIRPAPGPDYRPIPWVNVVLLVLLLAAALFVRAMWRQFRERTVDPFADRTGDSFDRAQARIAERRGRLRRWLDTWKAKDKR
ncbi:hypothetical protein OG2516_07902 [Oceanicola granulosus HTCC2516]|uniref:DUF1523 domain-containing protein n=1 Tax=Oceanicola granulosus (strain ATCC BAA-861 / DSM 15982 / KCTC 12143 / HTCC2516) TaxID=314256 RepID=Q2CI74_OCEGH|nr:DUF1523 family protein [Oceanicola granulosus]EAR52384.1 hypothetical protein OG2516_07902 [Oceanicola granulosus HTCC2516]